MHATAGRIIKPELLDDASGPGKQAALGDLVRIGRYLGGHRTVRWLFRRVTSRDEPFTVLDVGAASGDSANIIRGVRPRARVTSLDYRLDHLARAGEPKIAADAFHLPFAPRSFDFVFCSLFLHHFDNEGVIALLGSFGATARRAVLVNDLERGPMAYYFMPATRWLFHWDAITLHDAPASVEAGFTKHELEALATAAGLSKIEVRRHRPWARLTLIAR